ncbi:alanine racemase [Aquibaculum sediminis]|uniref:alanine racemase n=1 Tax=Aquibaculum sediminis TaxID=3231907 RepID=UPI00345652E6
MSRGDCQGGTVRPAWRELDPEALRGNYRHLRDTLAPGVGVIASIKANAYGHGAVETARLLAEEGVELLATGSFDEAVAIRKAGIDTPLLLFGGFLPDALPKILEWNLIPTVCNVEMAEALSRCAGGPTPLYIKIDCGLRRLGVPLHQARDFALHVAGLPNLEVAGLYTHVPFSSRDGRGWAERQLQEFDRLVAALAAAGLKVPVTQAMGSACLLAGLRDRCTAVSPGHLLYGLSPLDPEVAGFAPYRPVLKALRARLIHIGSYRPGTRPTLEGTEALEGADREGGAAITTGVVPLGRHDGYRSARDGRPATMLLRGRRVPVLSVTLEHSVLDLSAIEAPEIGECVTALGADGEEAIALDDLVHWWGVSPLEVLMTLDGSALATEPFARISV